MINDVVLVLALGSLYALIAAGVVVVYRTSRVLNFAQGELAVVAGYGAVTATAMAGGSILIGLATTLVVAGIVGGFIYLFLMRRLLGEAAFVGILLTVGLAILLRSVIILLWGGRIEVVDLGISGRFGPVAGASVNLRDVVTFTGASVGFGVIYLLYERSRMGVRMRAVAENVTLAALRGVNVDRMIATSWVVAVAAAGLAGTLYGARALLSVPAAVIGVMGITAALVGGLDSLKGAAIAGFLVAGAEHLTTQLVNPRYASLTPILLLLLVLVVRPWGLFGTPEEVERV